MGFYHNLHNPPFVFNFAGNAQMLADYLPIINVHQFQHDRQRKAELFSALCKEISRRGGRVGVAHQLTLSADGKHLDNSTIQNLVSNDLLAITGHCDLDCARLYLGVHLTVSNHRGGGQPCFVCTDISEVVACTDALFSWLAGCMQRTPVWGCILIGGRSSRMGHPKHLLDSGEGTSWLERSVEVLTSQVTNIVLSGGGKIPAALDSLERIDDIADRSGPLAGISAVVKAYPFVSWIVMACDMPDITIESIKWIIAQRKVGRLAVIPYNRVTGRIEPLYGWYDFRSAPLLESLAVKGEMRVHRIGQCHGVFKPVIPGRLAGAWRNVNRPEDINPTPPSGS